MLVIDIGNTNIVCGVFNGDNFLGSFRIATDLRRTADEYSMLFSGLLTSLLKSPHRIQQIGVSSVVPPLNPIVSKVCQNCFGAAPVFVTGDLNLGLKVEIPNPGTLGADRLVNALAMNSSYELPGMVVDFGTATTIDCIGATGSYLGGVILPGLETSLNALVAKASQLSSIELEWHSGWIGKSTSEAMQIGVLKGYVCMLESLVQEIDRELGGAKSVVATGGFGGFMVGHCKAIKTYDRNLTLMGLKIFLDKFNG